MGKGVGVDQKLQNKVGKDKATEPAGGLAPGVVVLGRERGAGHGLPLGESLGLAVPDVAGTGVVT